MINSPLGEQMGFEVRLALSYDEALEKVVAALKTEGFGVLTKIDVKATIKEKLGVEFRPYAILGACNPPLAHKALSADGVIGLMLPCNVTVEETPDNNSLVRIINPQTMLSFGEFSKNPILSQVAQDAHTRLKRVAESLEAN